jgi:hypothetical protein
MAYHISWVKRGDPLPTTIISHLRLSVFNLSLAIFHRGNGDVNFCPSRRKKRRTWQPTIRGDHWKRGEQHCSNISIPQGSNIFLFCYMKRYITLAFNDHLSTLSNHLLRTFYYYQFCGKVNLLSLNYKGFGDSL